MDGSGDRCSADGRGGGERVRAEADARMSARHPRAHRDPMDAAEAELAVRADRLGGFSFFFYCGDQCPAWQPGEAVSEFRYRELRRDPAAEEACDSQQRALEDADLMIRPTSTGSLPGTTCSFVGCVGRVAVRLDLRQDEGTIYALDLGGAIGGLPAQSRRDDPIARRPSGKPNTKRPAVTRSLGMGPRTRPCPRAV